MDLAVLENKIPIKSIPEQKLNKIILTQFTTWVSGLLSLTDEVSAERLEKSLPAIKKHCWSMGFSEIKKMFELYADGKLSIEPIPNYFDRILFGKIVKAYKMNQRQNESAYKVNSEEEKKQSDILNCITYFDAVAQHGFLIDECYWVYDYLVDLKKVVSFTNKEKSARMDLIAERDNLINKSEIINKAKLSLVVDYFKRLIAKDKHIKDFI